MNQEFPERYLFLSKQCRKIVTKQKDIKLDSGIIEQYYLFGELLIRFNSQLITQKQCFNSNSKIGLFALDQG